MTTPASAIGEMPLPNRRVVDDDIRCATSVNKGPATELEEEDEHHIF